MKYKFIDHRDKFLDKVISLGDKNSSTLGHFPKKAFYTVAKKKWILICYEEDKLLGYLMFRIVQKSNSISITHLCVSKKGRGRGISDSLVSRMRSEYEYLVRGVRLNCREDYTHAKKLWKRLGFKPVLTKRGRGVKETKLSLWWLDFHAQTLFTEYYDTKKLRVVLDANVIIDLSDSNPKKPFVKSLLSDWLSDDVDFFYASEIYLDIDSDKDTKRKDRTRKFIKQNFEESTFKMDDFNETLDYLKSIKECSNENDLSDLKQVAETVASGCQYFLTQDKDLLKLKDELFDKYGIYLMSPEEFLIDIDSITNSQDYQPARLAGANYDFRKVLSTELELITDHFLDNSIGEKKSQFTKRISELISNGNSELYLVKSDNEYYGLIGIRTEHGNTFIEIVRTGRHYLSNTLFQQLVSFAVDSAISGKSKKIIIGDEFLTESQESIVKSFQFHRDDGNWTKHVVCGIHDDKSLNELIKKREINLEIQLTKAPDSFHPKVERVLFPMKLIGHDIASYIIPIKPYWAAQLFDHISATSYVFGSKPELSWNRENVYYRSAKPKILGESGRILWYLSDNKKAPRKKCIVGCSFIENVEIDEAKLLFKRNKRLGIYEWKDIMSLTKMNAEKDIMSIRFSDTELFSTEVKLSDVQRILYSSTKKKYTFQSPVKISDDDFSKIYDLGFMGEMKKYG